MFNARQWVISVVLAVMIPGLAAAGDSPRAQKLDDALDDIARQLVKGSPSLGRGMTVAVADFGDAERRFTALGRHVAEEITTRIARSGSVRAIERIHLPTMLEELRFNEGTDLFDPGIATRLGRFHGAALTITGTLTDLGAVVRINARLFSTERGVIESAAAATVAKDNEVNRLLGVRLDPAPLLGVGRASGDNAAGPAPPPERAPSESVFSNHLIRTTVKSLRSINGRLTLELWYENLTDRNMTLVSSRWGRAYATDQRGSYLVGDNGEKWRFEEDTQVGGRYGGTELIPNQRLLNRIVFAPEGRNVGMTWTYVGDYVVRWTADSGRGRDEKFQVVIRDIEADAGSEFR